MADRRSAQLRAELEKEEVLLKSVKEKLLDQLQRLKVEELALMKYISLSNESPSDPATSTGTYFSLQENPNDIEANQNDNQINSVPLVDLTESSASNALMLNNDNVEEEDDDDD